jgi:hypothetical protein
MEPTTQTITFDVFADRLQHAKVMLIGDCMYQIGYIETVIAPPPSHIVNELRIVFGADTYAEDYTLIRSDNESVELRDGKYCVTFDVGSNGEREENVWVDLFKMERI